jgi:hemerythrin superfamily protein
MTILDKALTAMTPQVTPDAKAEARKRAQEAAQPGDWLSQILAHHDAIDQAFAAVKRAQDAGSRREAQRALGLHLTAHAIAEEAVIYPAMADTGRTFSAEIAYNEQAAMKMFMAALERLEPLEADYLDKLQHLERAIASHVHQEESDWLPLLKEKAPAAEQARMTARYAEEYDRYAKGGQDRAQDSRPEPRGEPRPLDEPRSFAGDADF